MTLRPKSSGKWSGAGKPRGYLTDREREVCRLLIDGFSTNQMIADELKISIETVKRYMTNVFDITGMSNRTELAMWIVNHPEVFNVNETGC